MINYKFTNTISGIFNILIVTFLFSCASAGKMDRIVSEQFNNQLPKQNTKKQPNIIVHSVVKAPNEELSNTVRKTSKVLPLIIYWQWEYRLTCTLNPEIPVVNFANSLFAIANRGLNQKLEGKQLELTIDQAPNTFAYVDKAHLLLFVVSWDHFYVEPNNKDLIVSYKVLEEGAIKKTGKIAVKNIEKEKTLRFFQSWKSATREYIGRYNQNVKTMTKNFMDQLIEEL